MKFHNVVFLFLLLTLVACGKGDGNTSSGGATLTSLSELGAGSYAVGCFHNKLASQGIGVTIYSKAVITLNEDATGSNAYELFDDVACSHLLDSGTVLITHYETVLVDENQVLIMDQDDGGSTTRLWIGYKQEANYYYLDLDFSDGESGPYLAEPTSAELSIFMAAPSSQGLILQ